MTIADMIDNATNNTNSKSNIVIFYHLYQINDWKKLYQEQMCAPIYGSKSLEIKLGIRVAGNILVSRSKLPI